MQAAALLENSMHLPSWFDSAVTAALLLGFPIAMLLTWAFEMTPEGVKRTELLEDGETVASSGRNMDGLIVLGLAAVLGLGAYQQMTKPDVVYVEKDGTAPIEASIVPVLPELGVEISDASIAVLPFADLSPAGDQEYFSDGIAEEILNVLVRVEALKVASRTSAFGFKGQEALGIPLIAEKLKVRHILEGSVRRSGDTVRITAQLIDAQTDHHIWSQTYDRTLTATNIFTIQDEISSEIVKALRTRLNVEIGDAQAVSMNTENLDAYELYIKARQKYLARSRENIPEIIALAKQATELDPGFAQAWAGLAAVYSVAPSWGVPGDNHIENSVAAAQKAIALDDTLALPYAALAHNLKYTLPNDFSAMTEWTNKALSLDPSNTSALLWRGTDEIALGFFDRANVYLEKCLAVDPNYQNCRRFLALSKLYAGETDEAFDLFDQGIVNGSSSQITPFLNTLMMTDQKRAGLYLLAWNWEVFDVWLRSISYRSMTDPTFDHEKELVLFKARYKAEIGEPFSWDNDDYSDLAITFRKYEHVQPTQFKMRWWDRSDTHFFKSPHRKRLIREMGIFDHWREHGFPPQCRPVGKDDFECE